MFSTNAIVRHIEAMGDYNRFFAQAEVTLAEDMDLAELQLKDVPSGARAIPLMNVKAGINIFHISGSGGAPFKVGDTIRVICFSEGETP